MIMKNARVTRNGDYIRFTDGLGNRRTKRIGTRTPPGPRARVKKFLRELGHERLRFEREFGIDPKYMHSHARAMAEMKAAIETSEARS